MSAFSATRFIPTRIKDLSPVLDEVEKEMTREGYSFTRNESASGTHFSITKGGIFKSVLGMKTALNVSLTPVSGGINAEAKVGIFGQQIIPTLISLFVAWPVLLTQITGLVQQAKLDDQVLSLIESQVRALEQQAYFEGTNSPAGSGPMQDFEFCTSCGAKIPAQAKFCSQCGTKLR